MRKKLFLTTAAGILVLFAFGACAGNAPSASGGVPLDEAIRQAAAVIEERLPAKTEVALINVRSPSVRFSEYVLDYLESILVNNGKLTVVDRSNLDKIRQEQGLQMSGEVSDESAKKIGKMLGAGAIITGTLISAGQVYRLTLKAINVELATVAASYPSDVANDGRMRALTGRGSSGTPAASSGKQASKNSSPAYKIGDTGPAGGLIFYDKGNRVSGWRYLEAAPANTEKTLVFSNVSIAMRNIGIRKTGSGKENTQAFLECFNEKGGAINTAAWYCDELAVNGFDDWFLPSLDELLYIYNNLYLKEIGGFKNAVYCSSVYRYGLNTVDFDNGNEDKKGSANKKYQVRAIRQF